MSSNNQVNQVRINPNDPYIRNKKTYKTLSIVSFILLGVFLLTTVVLWIAVRNQHVASEKVSVSIYGVHDGTKHDHVYITYNGSVYEIEDVNSGKIGSYKTAYIMGNKIDVYRSADGKFFSEMSSVKFHTPLGTVYYVFLIGTVVFALASLLLVSCVVEAKKREKGIYPKKGM